MISYYISQSTKLRRQTLNGKRKDTNSKVGKANKSDSKECNSGTLVII